MVVDEEAQDAARWGWAGLMLMCATAARVRAVPCCVEWAASHPEVPEEQPNPTYLHSSETFGWNTKT